MINIIPFELCCNQSIPEVYGEYFSYYEELCNIKTKINEVIKALEGFEENVLEQANAYTDTKVAALQASVNKQLSDMRQNIVTEQQAMREIMEQFQQAINLEVAGIQTSVSELWTAMSSLEKNVDIKFQLMYNDLKEYVEGLVSTLENVYAINPITGQREPLNSILAQMYRAYQWEQITAEEYDALELTAQEFDDLRITAYDYDNYGKLKMFDLFYLRMRSPFTGTWDTYENIINALAALHMDALTAEEYDALALTAEGYDAKDITAYDYDWKGKAILAGN